MRAERYKLPKGWAITELRSLVGPNGLFTDGDWVLSKHLKTGKDVRLLQLADIGVGEFLNKSKKFISKKTAVELKVTYLQPGDVLISRMAHPLARACVLPDIHQSCITAVDIAIARCDRKVCLPDFLMYTCNSNYILEQAESVASGTTRKRISRKRLGVLTCKLPPSNEQKRIVKKIESLLDRVTKTKQELAKIPPFIKKFRQSVLVKAFSGELTKEWRDQQESLESASALLARIREERKQELGKKYREPEPIDTSNLPELPEGWEWTRLDQIVNTIMGQSPPSSTYNLQKEGLPFFQGKAEFRKLYPSPVKWCRAPKKIAEAGDILISVRAPVGPTNLADQKCCIGRGLAAIRPLDKMPSKLVLYYLRHIEEKLSKQGQGSTFTAIGSDDLKNISLPLPPLDEQFRVVKRLEELFAQGDTIEKAVKIAQAHCQKLAQSILAKAFRGELVEQDPDDEPASMLLEKIKSEKGRMSIQNRVGSNA